MAVTEHQIGLTLDTIVLATDFSPASEKAAGYAQALAKHFSSSLTLAHVIDLSVAFPPADATGAPLIDEMRDTSADNLARLFNAMTSAGVRASVHTLEAENPAEALVGFAKGLGAHLIVEGTRAPHGLRRAVLGSCVGEVIRHASCPVLTVGPHAKPATKGALSYQSVLFATDFSSGAERQAAVALSFAKESVAKLYLCHVLEHPSEDISENMALEQKVESSLKNLFPKSTYNWCNPQCVVESGAAAAHILELAERVYAGLIVLGTKRHASWLSNLAEGTVGHVLAGAQCPVLTVAPGTSSLLPSKVAHAAETLSAERRYATA
jgi:nucleotide-binding universal stress UspA family protein